ncbi:hypothetical protein [Chitinophaga polysaccharea]|uniref:hypothetical protein n=1 Tax=Chitinophaga polysaccharea TaxID=1293035 RepID=UPI001158BBE3|nr:hypothetical protein [Chitinophaga polysaccharea]
MNTKQKYRFQIFSRIGAVFLLLIFLSTPLIEAFHHHHCNNGRTEQQYADNGNYQFNTFHIACKLCDLVKHQSHDFLPTQWPQPVFISPVKKAAAPLFRVQAYSSYLLACANKGPPVSC